MSMTTKQRKAAFISRGFDLSRIEKASGGDIVIIKCSQCNAGGINGHFVHETGCPNQMHECAGCTNMVGRGVKYCPDCQ